MQFMHRVLTFLCALLLLTLVVLEAWFGLWCWMLICVYLNLLKH